MTLCLDGLNGGWHLDSDYPFRKANPSSSRSSSFSFCNVRSWDRGASYPSFCSVSVIWVMFEMLPSNLAVLFFLQVRKTFQLRSSPEIGQPTANLSAHFSKPSLSGPFPSCGPCCCSPLSPTNVSHSCPVENA